MASATQTGNGNGKLKYVGTRPWRPDGVEKVTGRAKFGADISLPGMLVGRVLRSPHAHARIRSIDTARARALPGVKAIVTRDEMPEIPDQWVAAGEVQVNYSDMSSNVMAREKALYDGHAVAAVAATSAAIAKRALDLIEVGLRGAAARDRRARGDEAGRAGAPRHHVHPGRGADAGDAVERLQEGVLLERRPGGGIRRRRCRRRAHLHHQGGASGLYRAPRGGRQRQRGRAERDLVLHPGPVHRPRATAPPCSASTSPTSA